jgi:hypothetical protein
VADHDHDEMPPDPLLAMQQQLDQMLAAAPELARAARGIFDALESEGFTASQALYLTAVHFKESPFPPP